MSQLFEISVTLTEKQRTRIFHASNKGKTIIRISSDCLFGDDVLFVLEGTKLKLESETIRKRGMDIKIFPVNEIISDDEGKLFLRH